MHESECHERSCFVTLTYSDCTLPADRSLRVEDWQKFSKRLRKRVGQFRFFHCGEYGPKLRRPHYHACLFGVDFHEDRFFWKMNKGNKLYISPTLNKTWGLGFASVGNLTFESARYVARYCLKKQGGFNAELWYARIDPDTGEFLGHVRPEYCTMSRGSGKRSGDAKFRGGLGRSWLSTFEHDVYPSDEVVLNGKKYRPPRYYDSLLEEEELERIKVKRLRKALENPLSEDRLKAREQINISRMNLYSGRSDT